MQFEENLPQIRSTTWSPKRGRRMPGVLSFLTACVVLASGCTAGADDEEQMFIAASLDQDFQLRIGEAAKIQSEKLVIGFEAVNGDSRCGKGEQCFLEGDAVVRVWLQKGDGVKDVHELHTETRMPAAAVSTVYTIRLVNLHPVPLSGRTIAPDKYLATFRVVQGISGGDVVF